MWIRISERIHCPRHPKFNGSAVDARAGIKGGCLYCHELIELAMIRDRLERQIHELGAKIEAVFGVRP